ncbi:MAG: DNA-deoxyinosine glycosylase [Pseudomonadales bacterium]|nr:DNA-deoxyinosine glycosylase [Pseudomonadales bacterium]
MIHGFPSVVSVSATRLVLGSMPGERSLHENRYYAHPQNAFWRIIFALFDSVGNDKYQIENNYVHGLQLLQSADIGLWDVLQTCAREGSLDADIIETSVIANDFSKLLAEYPTIKKIYFNGAKAEHLYKRHVLPALNDQEKNLTMIKLPSTSPAYAAMSFEKKLQL